MKHINTNEHPGMFDLIASTRDVQAATMTLRPGSASDEQPSNEHRGSEQWLFVVSGAGEAIVGKRRDQLHRIALQPGSLLLIERGELHQITNTGQRSLRTINFYAPPAYDSAGEPLG
ncbi:MAG TPA: cupin domain-containing protein [Lacipirellulaceae bacterium]|nr:cupin domain-containing protein [Lacipirellulaceae bacterium]